MNFASFLRFYGKMNTSIESAAFDRKSENDTFIFGEDIKHQQQPLAVFLPSSFTVNWIVYCNADHEKVCSFNSMLSARESSGVAVFCIPFY